ncbi:hypothetical protein PRK78_005852 [Emydomyces testavorans]|uniref:F-box domain-containing protein n=1 Tax=Emydomyces testavorans TaxID=2070801 RepID=A0AAF0DMG9_9EURO|nr:hypothetical protein PRK78_005852 [Emydomyces testavorans]
MATTSLNDLPDEIILSILTCGTPTSAVALAQASRKFHIIATTPLLWRLYCRNYFNYWDERHCIREKFVLPVSRVNWKEIYKTRHLIDVNVTENLESILASQTGRIEKFHKILNFGYDAKDTLLRHAAVGSEHEDYLARRYYSNAILGCLHRSIAIPKWSRLRSGEDVSLECALAAFDMFVLETGGGDLTDILQRLDDIVAQIVADCPAIHNLSPRQTALIIAEYLQDKSLTGIDPGQEYYNIEHNFLGIALRNDRHNSLPLISAAIYCFVAKRRLQDGRQGAPMYMDPFRSIQETPIAELRSQLNFLGALSLSQSTFLRESLTSEIVLRCGKNILKSVTQIPRSRCTSLDIVNAKYAGLWSSMLFSDYVTLEGSMAGAVQGQRRPAGNIQLRRHLPSLMEHFSTDFPFDVYLVEKYLVPLFHGLPEYDHLRGIIHVMKASDAIPKQIRRRTSEHMNVKYRVGQVFRHRRYDYLAVITGWDPECGAEEQWLQQMGIDRLRAGRHQSFYHVFVPSPDADILGQRVEDKSVRYVAEENIERIELEISQIPQQFLKFLGQHFKRWDPITQTFVSNIKDEYPDD